MLTAKQGLKTSKLDVWELAVGLLYGLVIVHCPPAVDVGPTTQNCKVL